MRSQRRGQRGFVVEEVSPDIVEAGVDYQAIRENDEICDVVLEVPGDPDGQEVFVAPGFMALVHI